MTRWPPAAAALAVVWLMAGRVWALAALTVVLAVLWLTRAKTSTTGES